MMSGKFKLHFLILFISIFSVSQLISFEPFEPYSKHLIHPDNMPTKELQDLLALTGLNPNLKGHELVASTQESWLRRSKERWQEQDRFNEMKSELYPLLQKLGCVDEVSAKQAKYDYAIVLGATVNGTRPKLVQLIKEYNEGVKFGTVFFITADWQHDLSREHPSLLDLDQPNLDIKESWRAPEELPTTELEITKALVSQINFPKGLNPEDFVYIGTKDLTDANGNPRRATTKDTLEDLIKVCDLEGKSCAVFSLQPYVGYQDAVVRGTLPKTCRIETIGRGASKDYNYSVYMDSLARWIYQCEKNKS